MINYKRVVGRRVDEQGYIALKLSCGHECLTGVKGDYSNVGFAERRKMEKASRRDCRKCVRERAVAAVQNLEKHAAVAPPPPPDPPKVDFMMGLLNAASALRPFDHDQRAKILRALSILYEISEPAAPRNGVGKGYAELPVF